MIYLYEGALLLNMAHMHHLAELWAEYLRGPVLALIQVLLVYVNYGAIDDFLYLTESLSLSLDGHIQIWQHLPKGIR